jgi:hypothetical protein
MTDRLTLTRAFEGAGIKSDAAERLATEIYDAIHDNVATKQDLQQLETALRADLVQTRTELRANMQAMEQRHEHKIDTMVNRLVGAIVVAMTLLFGALHYWPPH